MSGPVRDSTVAPTARTSPMPSLLQYYQSCFRTSLSYACIIYPNRFVHSVDGSVLSAFCVCLCNMLFNFTHNSTASGPACNIYDNTLLNSVEFGWHVPPKSVTRLIGCRAHESHVNRVRVEPQLHQLPPPHPQAERLQLVQLRASRITRLIVSRGVRIAGTDGFWGVCVHSSPRAYCTLISYRLALKPTLPPPHLCSKIANHVNHRPPEHTPHPSSLQCIQICFRKFNTHILWLLCYRSNGGPLADYWSDRAEH